jgi:hypothetical protein
VKRIVLAAPCYGPRDPEIERALRIAIMSASRHAEWIGDVSTIRQGWVSARNMAVKSALEDAPDCDGIVWVDDDVLLPATAITRLLSYEQAQDFVTGVVFQKMGDYNPLVAKWVGNGFAWWRKFPENVLAPADGCGFGCVYTSTKMLRAIAQLPSEIKPFQAYFKKDGWFDQFPANHFGKQIEQDQAMSEDFSFCMRAKMAGFQLYADTGLLASHMIGPKFSTKATFDKHWAEKDKEAAELKEKQTETLALLDGSAA